MAQKHALLLTDGADEHETPEQLDAAIRGCIDKPQCDCRGVGTYWVVSEVRKISRALMGTLDIIPEPSMMAAEFAKIMQTAMNRGSRRRTCGSGAAGRAVALRPAGLAHRGGSDQSGQPVNLLTADFPTAWGDACRRGTRLSRVGPAAGQGGRPGAAGGPRATGGGRPAPYPGHGQGRLVERRQSDCADQQ